MIERSRKEPSKWNVEWPLKLVKVRWMKFHRRRGKEGCRVINLTESKFFWKPAGPFLFMIWAQILQSQISVFTLSDDFLSLLQLVSIESGYGMFDRDSTHSTLQEKENFNRYFHRPTSSQTRISDFISTYCHPLNWLNSTQSFKDIIVYSERRCFNFPNHREFFLQKQEGNTRE